MGQRNKGFFAGVKDKIKSVKSGTDKKVADYYEKNDPIYTQPLTAREEAPAGGLKRGGIDYLFLISVAALVVFGAVMSYSASSVYALKKYGDSTYFLKNYLLYLLAALVVTFPIVRWGRVWFLKLFSAFAFGGSIILLILVVLVGTERGGAKRWISIGGFTIQPSEIAKMAVVLMLALLLAKYDDRLQSKQKFGGQFRYGILIPGCVIAIICGLVVLEKHLSGTIIIGFLGLFMMFVGGSSKKWLGWICGVGAAGVAFVVAVSDYAQKRINTWLHIYEVDPLGEAWQTLQGLYAIGSGGFFGLGLGNSRQKYGYVAEPQNDFIFTIICEELGFIGAFAVISLVALLVWRGYKIAANAPDKFSSLAVYGLVTKVGLQTLLNIAVVTNSMPNTGISLPFFSSGGSALVIQIFEMGIVLCISRYSYSEK